MNDTTLINMVNAKSDGMRWCDYATYEVVTSAGHLLGSIPNLEDARDFRDLMDRKLRAQGFRPPPYPARLVGIRYARTAPTL